MLPVPHVVPQGPLLHLQQLGGWLPTWRGDQRIHDQVRQVHGRQRRHPPEHDERPGRPERQPDGPQRTGAGGADLEGHQDGAHDPPGVLGVGVPRHGHLAGGPDRDRGSEEGADPDAEDGAPDALVEQDQHWPPGGRCGHGRAGEVHHPVQAREVLPHAALAHAEPAPGALPVRRDHGDRGRLLPLPAGPQPGVVVRLRGDQRPRDLLGPELQQPARRVHALDAEGGVEKGPGGARGRRGP
mmetsp:Transcript_179544/g.436848  ORF Transcript_179544/g.436848 Transcript_179544/m.436848 type:complete len:241 (-) Transcript_179544:1040-1762(-)